MNRAPSRTLQWTVWGGLGGLILLILLAFLLRPGERREESFWEGLPPVGDFQLTNQFGRPFGLNDLQGKVWIADIVFTRCPGPCTTMSSRMAELQAALPPEWPVMLVSLTTDPDHDTPAVLAEYAQRFGAAPERWQFLTGDKEEIRRLATAGLRLAAMEKPAADRESPNDLWIHSTIFVVVDQKGRLRAVFESLPRASRDESETAVDPEAHFDEVKRNILATVEALVKKGGG